MTEFSKPLGIHATPIPGLLVIDLPVHGDSRGWFKENWQRDKMLAAGLPDFGPVQNNISFNDEVGTTRGIHAEPWDKFVSVATGKIFGAWVDLRQGPTFGKVFTAEIDPSQAVFIPRGVANSYQTLEVDTSYVYLVNDHWRPDAAYTFLNLEDETVAIDWPIPLNRAAISEKDKAHPRLSNVVPMPPKKTLVLGANGQIGRALRTVMPKADFVTRELLDIQSAESLSKWKWPEYDTVINAAAYTEVDLAETTDGRSSAWDANAGAVQNLATHCAQHRITLVHISSDYVFDGSKSGAYTEGDAICPLGVYGQTKAAGDLAAAAATRHYIVRTSWVIGDGNNFVKTMASLAQDGINPSVVDDQRGRLTFASDVAAGIAHLLNSGAPYGVYNLTNEGPVISWAEIARRVFELLGSSVEVVTGVSTEDYFADKTGTAPRPKNSLLDIGKLKATGFIPPSWEERLAQYVRDLA